MVDTRSLFPVAAALSLLAATHPADATVNIYRTSFLPGWTNYNGFEGLGRTIAYRGANGYAEQGITVTYVGTPGTIMTTIGSAEGRYSWYPNAGSNGYTSITFGGIIEAVSFLASTGFGGASSPDLHFELLLGGVSLASGLAGNLNIFGDGWSWYGFSGVQFDELRLQARADLDDAFLPTAYDALALDGIRFNGYWQPPVPVSGVPDAPHWSLLVAGFGLAGVGARTRRKRSGLS